MKRTRGTEAAEAAVATPALDRILWVRSAGRKQVRPHAGQRVLQAAVCALLAVGVLCMERHPAERLYAVLRGQRDDFQKLPLNFKAGGVPVRWGYAGQLGFNRALVENAVLPPRLDLNIDGQKLVLDGLEHPEGIGTQAPSEIALATGGSYARFSCLVGLDDGSTGSHGVFCYLLADGKEIYRSPKLYPASKALEIDVPIAGVQELVLGVDTTDLEDLRSDFDWVGLNFSK